MAGVNTGQGSLRPIPLDSESYKMVLNVLTKSFLDRDYKWDKWKISEAWRIINEDLSSQYENKKREMEGTLISPEETTETYCFTAVGKKKNYLMNIINFGLKAHRTAYNEFGASAKGLYLSKHCDTMLKYAEQHKDNGLLRILIHKVTLGRQLAVRESSHTDPTVGYDCHVSAIAPSPDQEKDSQVIYSQVYVYELDKENQPMVRPRQCLPVAVVKFDRLKEETTPRPSPVPTPEPALNPAYPPTTSPVTTEPPSTSATGSASCPGTNQATLTTRQTDSTEQVVQTQTKSHQVPNVQQQEQCYEPQQQIRTVQQQRPQPLKQQQQYQQPQHQMQEQQQESQRPPQQTNESQASRPYQEQIQPPQQQLQQQQQQQQQPLEQHSQQNQLPQPRGEQDLVRPPPPYPGPSQPPVQKQQSQQQQQQQPPLQLPQQQAPPAQQVFLLLPQQQLGDHQVVPTSLLPPQQQQTQMPMQQPPQQVQQQIPSRTVHISISELIRAKIKEIEGCRVQAQNLKQLRQQILVHPASPQQRKQLDQVEDLLRKAQQILSSRINLVKKLQQEEQKQRAQAQQMTQMQNSILSSQQSVSLLRPGASVSQPAPFPISYAAQAAQWRSPSPNVTRLNTPSTSRGAVHASLPQVVTAASAAKRLGQITRNRPPAAHSSNTRMPTPGLSSLLGSSNQNQTVTTPALSSPLGSSNQNQTFTTPTLSSLLGSSNQNQTVTTGNAAARSSSVAASSPRVSASSSSTSHNELVGHVLSIPDTTRREHVQNSEVNIQQPQTVAATPVAPNVATNVPLISSTFTRVHRNQLTVDMLGTETLEIITDNGKETLMYLKALIKKRVDRGLGIPKGIHIRTASAPAVLPINVTLANQAQPSNNLATDATASNASAAAASTPQMTASTPVTEPPAQASPAADSAPAIQPIEIKPIEDYDDSSNMVVVKKEEGKKKVRRDAIPTVVDLTLDDGEPIIIDLLDDDDETMEVEASVQKVEPTEENQTSHVSNEEQSQNQSKKVLHEFVRLAPDGSIEVVQEMVEESELEKRRAETSIDPVPCPAYDLDNMIGEEDMVDILGEYPGPTLQPEQQQHQDQQQQQQQQQKDQQQGSRGNDTRSLIPPPQKDTAPTGKKKSLPTAAPVADAARDSPVSSGKGGKNSSEKNKKKKNKKKSVEKTPHSSHTGASGVTESVENRREGDKEATSEPPASIELASSSTNENSVESPEIVGNQEQFSTNFNDNEISTTRVRGNEVEISGSFFPSTDPVVESCDLEIGSVVSLADLGQVDLSAVNLTELLAQQAASSKEPNENHDQDQALQEGALVHEREQVAESSADVASTSEKDDGKHSSCTTLASADAQDSPKQPQKKSETVPPKNLPSTTDKAKSLIKDKPSSTRDTPESSKKLSEVVPKKASTGKPESGSALYSKPSTSKDAPDSMKNKSAGVKVASVLSSKDVKDAGQSTKKVLGKDKPSSKKSKKSKHNRSQPKPDKMVHGKIRTVSLEEMKQRALRDLMDSCEDPAAEFDPRPRPPSFKHSVGARSERHPPKRVNIHEALNDPRFQPVVLLHRMDVTSHYSQKQKSRDINEAPRVSSFKPSKLDTKTASRTAFLKKLKRSSPMKRYTARKSVTIPSAAAIPKLSHPSFNIGSGSGQSLSFTTTTLGGSLSSLCSGIDGAEPKAKAAEPTPSTSGTMASEAAKRLEEAFQAPVIPPQMPAKKCSLAKSRKGKSSKPRPRSRDTNQNSRKRSKSPSSSGSSSLDGYPVVRRGRSLTKAIAAIFSESPSDTSVDSTESGLDTSRNGTDGSAGTQMAKEKIEEKVQPYFDPQLVPDFEKEYVEQDLLNQKIPGILDESKLEANQKGTTETSPSPAKCEQVADKQETKPSPSEKDCKSEGSPDHLSDDYVLQLLRAKSKAAKNDAQKMAYEAAIATLLDTLAVPAESEPAASSGANQDEMSKETSTNNTSEAPEKAPEVKVEKGDEAGSVVPKDSIRSEIHITLDDHDYEDEVPGLCDLPSGDIDQGEASKQEDTAQDRDDDEEVTALTPVDGLDSLQDERWKILEELQGLEDTTRPKALSAKTGTKGKEKSPKIHGKRLKSTESGRADEDDSADDETRRNKKARQNKLIEEDENFMDSSIDERDAKRKSRPKRTKRISYTEDSDVSDTEQKYGVRQSVSSTHGCVAVKQKKKKVKHQRKDLDDFIVPDDEEDSDSPKSQSKTKSCTKKQKKQKLISSSSESERDETSGKSAQKTPIKRRKSALYTDSEVIRELISSKSESGSQAEGTIPEGSDPGKWLNKMKQLNSQTRDASYDKELLQRIRDSATAPPSTTESDTDSAQKPKADEKKQDSSTKDKTSKQDVTTEAQKEEPKKPKHKLDWDTYLARKKDQKQSEEKKDEPAPATSRSNADAMPSNLVSSINKEDLQKILQVVKMAELKSKGGIKPAVKPGGFMPGDPRAVSSHRNKPSTEAAKPAPESKGGAHLMRNLNRVRDHRRTLMQKKVQLEMELRSKPDDQELTTAIDECEHSIERMDMDREIIMKAIYLERDGVKALANDPLPEVLLYPEEVKNGFTEQRVPLVVACNMTASIHNKLKTLKTDYCAVTVELRRTPVLETATLAKLKRNLKYVRDERHKILLNLCLPKTLPELIRDISAKIYRYNNICGRFEKDYKRQSTPLCFERLQLIRMRIEALEKHLPMLKQLEEEKAHSNDSVMTIASPDGGRKSPPQPTTTQSPSMSPSPGRTDLPPWLQNRRSSISGQSSDGAHSESEERKIPRSTKQSTSGMSDNASSKDTVTPPSTGIHASKASDETTLKDGKVQPVEAVVGQSPVLNLEEIGQTEECLKVKESVVETNSKTANSEPQREEQDIGKDQDILKSPKRSDMEAQISEQSGHSTPIDPVEEIEAASQTCAGENVPTERTLEKSTEKAKGRSRKERRSEEERAAKRRKTDGAEKTSKEKPKVCKRSERSRRESGKKGSENDTCKSVPDDSENINQTDKIIKNKKSTQNDDTEIGEAGAESLGSNGSVDEIDPDSRAKSPKIDDPKEKGSSTGAKNKVSPKVKSIVKKIRQDSKRSPTKSKNIKTKASSVKCKKDGLGVDEANPPSHVKSPKTDEREEKKTRTGAKRSPEGKATEKKPGGKVGKDVRLSKKEHSQLLSGELQCFRKENYMFYCREGQIRRRSCGSTVSGMASRLGPQVKDSDGKKVSPKLKKSAAREKKSPGSTKKPYRIPKKKPAVSPCKATEKAKPVILSPIQFPDKSPSPSATVIPPWLSKKANALSSWSCASEEPPTTEETTVTEGSMIATELIEAVKKDMPPPPTLPAQASVSIPDKQEQVVQRRDSASSAETTPPWQTQQAKEWRKMKTGLLLSKEGQNKASSQSEEPDRADDHPETLPKPVDSAMTSDVRLVVTSTDVHEDLAHHSQTACKDPADLETEASPSGKDTSMDSQDEPKNAWTQFLQEKAAEESRSVHPWEQFLEEKKEKAEKKSPYKKSPYKRNLSTRREYRSDSKGHGSKDSPVSYPPWQRGHRSRSPLGRSDSQHWHRNARSRSPTDRHSWHHDARRRSRSRSPSSRFRTGYSRTRRSRSRSPTMSRARLEAPWSRHSRSHTNSSSSKPAPSSPGRRSRSGSPALSTTSRGSAGAHSERQSSSRKGSNIVKHSSSQSHSKKAVTNSPKNIHNSPLVEDINDWRGQWADDTRKGTVEKEQKNDCQRPSATVSGKPGSTQSFQDVDYRVETYRISTAPTPKVGTPNSLGDVDYRVGADRGSPNAPAQGTGSPKHIGDMDDRVGTNRAPKASTPMSENPKYFSDIDGKVRTNFNGSCEQLGSERQTSYSEAVGGELEAPTSMAERHKYFSEQLRDVKHGLDIQRQLHKQDARKDETTNCGQPIPSLGKQGPSLMQQQMQLKMHQRRMQRRLQKQSSSSDNISLN